MVFISQTEDLSVHIEPRSQDGMSVWWTICWVKIDILAKTLRTSLIVRLGFLRSVETHEMMLDEIRDLLTHGISIDFRKP